MQWTPVPAPLALWEKAHDRWLKHISRTAASSVTAARDPPHTTVHLINEGAKTHMYKKQI